MVRAMRRFTVRFLVCLSVPGGLSGCAGTSPPVRFYALEAAGPAAPLARRPELAIGLGPVLLPETLDRPQLVVRLAPFRVELAEFHQWAGNLGADLARLLGERLGGHLGTQRLFLHPWPRHRDLQAQVRVEVTRLEGNPGGAARLSGHWTLLDGAGRQERSLAAFDLQEPVAGSEMQDLVAAYSRLAERLAEHIARGLLAAD
jgi:uncharacterized lipoprotein YmbA